jgi:hypothetical protein
MAEFQLQIIFDAYDEKRQRLRELQANIKSSMEAHPSFASANERCTSAKQDLKKIHDEVVDPSTFEELVHEQTPGGLNEQVIREMTEAGAYTALSDSLDNILARIEARPAPVRSTTPYSSAIDVDPV